MFRIKFLHDVRNEFGLFAKGDTIEARHVGYSGRVKLDGKSSKAAQVEMKIAGSDGTKETDFVTFQVPAAWIENETIKADRAALKYAGMMGHAVVTVETALNGGSRTRVQCNTVDEAVRYGEPGQRVYERRKDKVWQFVQCL